MLIALNAAFGVRVMDLLLFLHFTADKVLWHSADGVLEFAGLIASGLVEITQETVATPMQISQSSHRVALTPRGQLLVDAWLAGDEGQYRQALTRGN
jgi:hypothetical protein